MHTNLLIFMQLILFWELSKNVKCYLSTFKGCLEKSWGTVKKISMASFEQRTQWILYWDFSSDPSKIHKKVKKYQNLKLNISVNICHIEVKYFEYFDKVNAHFY